MKTLGLLFTLLISSTAFAINHKCGQTSCLVDCDGNGNTETMVPFSSTSQGPNFAGMTDALLTELCQKASGINGQLANPNRGNKAIIKK